MKKVLLLVAVFCMLVVPFAQSEGMDWSQLSIEELLSIKQQINDELLSRISPDTVYSGLYRAGKDIEPGSYLITASSINSEKYDTLFVAVFDNEEKFEELETLTYENIGLGETIHVYLEEGMVMKINRGECLISKDSTK